MELTMKHSLLFLLVCIAIPATASHAQVPKTISYQGLLTTSGGSPASDGNYTLQFDQYDSLSGGTSQWTETQSGVAVVKGTFNVILGSVAALTPPFNKKYFLGVTATAGPGIGSPQTFAPRSELTSAPYAILATSIQGPNSVATGDGTVAGGSSNTANNLYATVSGGFSNTASGIGATIGGGSNNLVSGDVATVPGGVSNAARGTGSFAGGRIAKANHNAAIVLAANSSNNSHDSVASGGNEQIVLRADGGMYVTNHSEIAPYDTSKLINTSVGAYLKTNGSLVLPETLFASNVSSNSPLRLQTAGTTRIYVDDATGRVGIGTAAPSEKLSVAGNVSATEVVASSLEADPGIGILAIGLNSNTIGLTIIPPLKVGSLGTSITRILSHTGTLDFPSTASQSASNLDVSVPGAALGDVVSLGVPDVSTLANSTYTAWVSLPNIVTVRFTNPSIAAQNPASGTFRVMVIQF